MGPVIKSNAYQYTGNANLALSSLTSGVRVIKREWIEYYKAQAQAEKQKQAEAEAAEAKPARRGAFWEQDDGEREMLSAKDFEKFLKENGVGM